jgi:excisionase family DNA binding protein
VSPAPPAPSDPNAFFNSIEADSVRKERLLGVRQVAERLRVSTATVYKLCDRGELPHTRVVNVIRVAPEELETFIARRGSTPNRAHRKRRR